VVLHAPRGAAAARLWELVKGWREFPELYEMRKPKTRDDMAKIGAKFSTYLNARAWHTVENPAL
jgi:hypothetical protein